MQKKLGRIPSPLSRVDRPAVLIPCPLRALRFFAVHLSGRNLMRGFVATLMRNMAVSAMLET
jgi:hypothetical protein